MGKRGPKKTPTAILKLRGTKIGEFERKGEVQATGLPQMPQRIYDDELAAQCWQFVVPQLTAIGCAKEVDTQPLERYCLTWARWARAVDEIRANGETDTRISTNGDSYEVVRPIVRIENILAGQLNKLEAEFGIGAASRAGLNVQTPAVDDLAEDMVG